MFWQRQSYSHQHRGPQRCVKTGEDVFGHPVHVGGPKFFPPGIWPSGWRNVVNHCIKPYINDSSRVSWGRNAPSRIDARDAYIPQTLFDKADDFVTTVCGGKKFWI